MSVLRENKLANGDQVNSVSSASPERRRYLAASSRERTLARLTHAAFVLTGVVTTFLGPLLPALSVRWQLSDAQAGYFFSAQFMGSIVGSTLTSTLLPRRGFRFSMALGYVLMALGVGALALTQWRLALLGTCTYAILLEALRHTVFDHTIEYAAEPALVPWKTNTCQPAATHRDGFVMTLSPRPFLNRCTRTDFDVIDHVTISRTPAQASV